MCVSLLRLPKISSQFSYFFDENVYVYLQIVVRLSKGLGISVVDRTPEELVYILFRDVAIEYVQENEEQTLRADVRSLQVRLCFFLRHCFCC